MIDLSIIIVSYNTVDLIGNCLDSIYSLNDVSKEVHVIENASADGSASLIQKNFPMVSLTINSKNRGFAAANNQVLPLCRGRYIFFLNPDTKVISGALAEAITFMDANPHIGLAGTKIINPDGSLQDSISYRYPGQKYARDELTGLKGVIACVLGASMIAPSKLIRDVNGFDESFFLYGEDQDLCLRIRKNGFEIGYIDSAVVVHFRGQSERRSTSAEVWKKKLTAEHLFYRKHYLPETIARIKRTDILKARWRIATLKLAMPFVKDKAKAIEKLIKYDVIYKELKQGLP